MCLVGVRLCVHAQCLKNVDGLRAFREVTCLSGINHRKFAQAQILGVLPYVVILVTKLSRSESWKCVPGVGGRIWAVVRDFDES